MFEVPLFILPVFVRCLPNKNHHDFLGVVGSLFGSRNQMMNQGLLRTLLARSRCRRLPLSKDLIPLGAAASVTARSLSPSCAIPLATQSHQKRDLFKMVICCTIRIPVSDLPGLFRAAHGLLKVEKGWNSKRRQQPRMYGSFAKSISGQTLLPSKD